MSYHSVYPQEQINKGIHFKAPILNEINRKKSETHFSILPGSSQSSANSAIRGMDVN